MQPIQINVSVSIDVSQRLFDFMKGLTGARIQERPSAEAAPAPTPKTKKKSMSSELVQVPEPKPAQEQSAEPEKAEAEAAAAKELTEQDIREAIHRTRRRIEGEDYATNTQGERYTLYHRQLTAAFKNIAAFLGSDRPSALAPDKRAAFIEQCDELAAEDGKITTKIPF